MMVLHYLAIALLLGIVYLVVGLGILVPIRDVRFWRKVHACPLGTTFPLLIWPATLVAWLLRDWTGAFD